MSMPRRTISGDRETVLGIKEERSLRRVDHIGVNLGQIHQMCNSVPRSPQFLQQTLNAEGLILASLDGVRYQLLRIFYTVSQCRIHLEIFRGLWRACCH